MIWQIYLINTLIGCGIALLIALTIAVIQVIAVLLDIRHTTNAIKKKVNAVISAIDVVSGFFGGMERAKKRTKKNVAPNKSTLIAFAAGIKEGLEVLLGDKEPLDKLGAKEKSDG